MPNVYPIRACYYTVENGLSAISQYGTVQGESKKSDDCDMYNRNVIPCGV